MVACSRLVAAASVKARFESSTAHIKSPVAAAGVTARNRNAERIAHVFSELPVISEPSHGAGQSACKRCAVLVILAMSARLGRPPAGRYKFPEPGITSGRPPSEPGFSPMTALAV